MKRSLIAALILAGSLAIGVWMLVFLSTPGHPADQRFSIVPGQGVEQIIAGLSDRGFVRSRLLFGLALRQSGLATRLQPGTYDLTEAKDYRDVIEMFAAGRLSADEVKLRVIEGWSLRDIASYLEAGDLRTSASELFALTGRPVADFRKASAEDGNIGRWKDFDFLSDRPAGAGLEGYLFPDTYRVFADAKVEDVVRKMLENFGRKLTPELRAELVASGHSIYDTVTMASIVEREVRSDEDRALVADIFWRRLKIGMAMQADSTVNYATGKTLPAVTRADTEVDSPYNTYRYRGLPLGPICNPGLSSIQATIRPEANDYWFFLTDKEGGVHYAKTLEDHNRNKSKYLK